MDPDLSKLFEDLAEENFADNWDKIEKGQPVPVEELNNMLHSLAAIRLLYEVSKEDSGPGWMQAALRFLDQNDITGLGIPGSAQDKLRRKLGREAPFKPRLSED